MPQLTLLITLLSLLLCHTGTAAMSAATRGSSATLLPLLGKLNENFKVVLASGSPRRKELLALMGLPNFSVLVSNFAEDLDHSTFSTPQDYCLKTAAMKVEQVVLSMPATNEKTLVIGADTIVEINGKILEKPVDDADSLRMLKMMSNNVHFVHTAVIAYSNCGNLNQDSSIGPMVNTVSFVETTQVRFCDLTEADIAAYIALGEGRDKAGSYGIQGAGGQMVKSIEGCYFNVMGLPIHSLSSKLAASFTG
ncbi:inosine triphosphate pyrophosphatase-like protein [Ochromonadaceae sp. CCMP2298]|nr:inosine triphosphate pyrophosphatase-like protein [Ochromonadaceae sp. CCMP2298]